uniref:Putative serine/threonine protein phosphatase pp1 n=1 Tax=Ixodes ricinus TaxID=34613 RepID=A0A0K8RE32_IXORI
MYPPGSSYLLVTSSSRFGSKVYARWASPALAWLPLPLRATGRVCRPYNALYRSCTVQCTTTACRPPLPAFPLGPFFFLGPFLCLSQSTLYIGDVEPLTAASPFISSSHCQEAH